MWLGHPWGHDLQELPERRVVDVIDRRRDCEPGEVTLRRCEAPEGTSRRVENPGVQVTTG